MPDSAAELIARLNQLADAWHKGVPLSPITTVDDFCQAADALTAAAMREAKLRELLGQMREAFADDMSHVPGGREFLAQIDAALAAPSPTEGA